MTKLDAWLPMWWPGSPLQAVLTKTPTADARAAYDWWFTPASLEIIRDTPINCLLMPWSGTGDRPAGLSALVQAAHERGVAVVGRVPAEADPKLAEANALKLDALIVDKPVPAGSMPAFIGLKLDEMERVPAGELLAVAGAVWPQIPMKGEGGGGGDAGPTGNPWLDSNGWAIQLLEVKAPGRRVWVLAEPPAERALLRTQAYQLAIADAAIHGGAWPICLDARMAADLAGGNSSARSAWGQMVDTVRFFQKRPAPAPVIARLGVCSSFTGENAFMAGEVLNLAARRGLPYRILDRENLTPKHLSGLRALLWVDEQPPEGQVKSMLLGFAQAGGLLMLPTSASPLAAGLKPASAEHAYNMFALGQGRIAVPKEAWSDPWVLAAEAHLLLGRRNDVFRMWNAGTCMTRYAEQGDHGRAEILNYSGRPAGHMVSLFISKPYRSASYTSFESPTPKTLAISPRDGGIEVNLPPFPVYCGIELGA